MKSRSLITVIYKDLVVFGVRVEKFTPIEEAVREYLRLKDAPIEYHENQKILGELAGKEYPFIFYKDRTFLIDMDGFTFGKIIPIQEKFMNRITFKNPDGTWGIGNYDITLIPKLYEALTQLRDYEETGLSPDEVLDMKENYQRKCSEAERYKKLSLSVEEMAKILVILDEFKKLKQGEKAQPEEEKVQSYCEQVRRGDEDYYFRMLTYARKMLVEICAGEVCKGTNIAMKEHLSRLKKQAENAIAMLRENELPKGGVENERSK